MYRTFRGSCQDTGLLNSYDISCFPRQLINSFQHILAADINELPIHISYNFAVGQFFPWLQVITHDVLSIHSCDIFRVRDIKFFALGNRIRPIQHSVLQETKTYCLVFHSRLYIPAFTRHYSGECTLFTHQRLPR